MNSVKFKDNLASVRNNSYKEKCPLRIVITEAASYIGRSLAYRILSDNVFGNDQELIFSLFDSSGSVVFLQGIAIEISACAPNLLKDITYSRDPAVAFKDADVIFSIGKARDYNFSKSDLYTDPFFRDSVIETKSNAQAIERYAKKNAKVITLGNTAARIISEYAPSIPKKNITAVSMVLQKLSAFWIAKRTNRLPSEVKNLIIWGTNSKSAFPYLRCAKFSDGKSVMEEINSDEWCKKTLPKLLGAFFRKCRYRTSEALAMADHCKYLVQGTPEDEWTSMSVISDGSYGVEFGVFFSFPVYCKDGNWEIVKGLHIDEYCKTVIEEILTRIDEKVEAGLKICRELSFLKKPKKSLRKKLIIKVV